MSCRHLHDMHIHGYELYIQSHVRCNAYYGGRTCLRTHNKQTAENERLGLLRHSHEFYGADLSALFSAMGSVMHTSYGNNRTCSQSLGLKKTAARLNRIIYNKIIFFVLPMHKNGIN